MKVAARRDASQGDLTYAARHAHAVHIARIASTAAHFVHRTLRSIFRNALGRTLHGTSRSTLHDTSGNTSGNTSRNPHGTLHRTLLALVAFGAASLAGPACADELTGTLKKIHDDGVVVLGVREASIPFSYFDGKGTVGFSQSIALQIVDEIKKTLGMPQLKVHEITVTASNRTPMLLNNQIDLECGSTTHTVERENVAAFSDSFFQYAVRLIARKRSGITDFPGLAGKAVVTTAGSSDERLLRLLNIDKHLNMRITSTRDQPEAFTTLKDDRAVALVMDEPVAYGFKATDPRPDDFVVTGTPLGYEAYACMFRKGDEPLRNLVNGVISRSQTSGDAERLYRQWFTQPIPPHGINLNFPLSEQNRALFAHPNDHALD